MATESGVWFGHIKLGSLLDMEVNTLNRCQDICLEFSGGIEKANITRLVGTKRCVR